MKMISRVLESEVWVRQLFLILFGLYLVIFPSLGLRLFLMAVVVGCVGLGIFNLIKFYLGSKKKKNGYTSHLFIAIIQLGIGIILYLNLEHGATISIYLFAIFLVIHGGMDLKYYFEHKEMDENHRNLSLVVGSSNLALAALLVVSPFRFLASQPVLIGVALIVINGLGLYKNKFLKHKKQEEKNDLNTK